MKKHTLITTSLVVALVITAAVLAMAQGGKKSHENLHQLDCTNCHVCSTPTLRDPCLRTCPRSEMVRETAQHSIREAPDSMMIDELQDIYGPVRFNHKLHAEMAEMGGDCATCHHYSPEDEIPPCKECHLEEAEVSTLRQPTLKGAYHRQCLSCHREWSHDTKCVVCHIPQEEGLLAAAQPDPTDIIGQDHPVITEPTTKVYRTPYQKGPVVTFHHEEHIELFGLKCVDCHQKESCGYCHDIEQHAELQKSMEEVHAICNDCHLEDPCSKCHDTQEKPAFSHAQTGWPLSQYHQGLDCRACHPTGKPIARLNSDCANCHAGWNQENFEHAVVGFQLDEIHSMAECTDCHENREFTKQPSCGGCHDDDRTAEDAPPGEYVKRS